MEEIKSIVYEELRRRIERVMYDDVMGDTIIIVGTLKEVSGEIAKNLEQIILQTRQQTLQEVGMYEYTCKQCGKKFITDSDDEGQTLCTPCWKSYVAHQHNSSISVEDKVRLSNLVSKENE